MSKLLALVAIAVFGSPAAPAVTARQVISRIQQQNGVSIPNGTVDTVKAGNPDAPVSGIAVTMMATFAVLQRAAAEKKNLIITHEPTFYSHTDTLDELQSQNDPITREKLEFIRQHNQVIWRFHDGWHLHRPDGILLGMTHALGWNEYRSPVDPHLFILAQPVTLEELASQVRLKLSIQSLRVVGDPRATIRKVALQPGAAGKAVQIRILERDDVEALLIGEVPEWETIEYVNDAYHQGRRKALILLGHVPSEQAGMEECATWLRGFIREVPVSFVPTPELFWPSK